MLAMIDFYIGGYIWGGDLPAMCLEAAGGIIKCCKYIVSFPV